jgi:hypothetical protein
MTRPATFTLIGSVMALSCGQTPTPTQYLLTSTATPGSAKPGAAKPADCDFQLVNLPPQKDFEEIGMVTHIAGNRESNPKIFKESIRQDVCSVGGEIVLTQVNDLGEFVRGTIVRLTPTPSTINAGPEFTSADKSELEKALDVGIRAVGENNFEIDKTLVETVLSNPMALAKGARFAQAMKDGKPSGLKVYAVRPSSVYFKLGLYNGDTLNSINGFDINSAEDGLEAYTKFRESQSLQILITRRQQVIQLKYSIK